MRTRAYGLIRAGWQTRRYSIPLKAVSRSPRWAYWYMPSLHSYYWLGASQRSGHRCILPSIRVDICLHRLPVTAGWCSDCSLAGRTFPVAWVTCPEHSLSEAGTFKSGRHDSQLRVFFPNKPNP
jgi:hypothetical protein